MNRLLHFNRFIHQCDRASINKSKCAKEGCSERLKTPRNRGQRTGSQPALKLRDTFALTADKFPGGDKLYTTITSLRTRKGFLESGIGTRTRITLWKKKKKKKKKKCSWSEIRFAAKRKYRTLSHKTEAEMDCSNQSALHDLIHLKT